MSDRLAAYRLREARVAAGYTQQQVGGMLNPAVDERRVRLWENPDEPDLPTARHRQQLVHALGVPIWRVWPPEDVARALSTGERHLLATAARHHGGFEVVATTDHEKAAARHLIDRWVAEYHCESAAIRGAKVYVLTPFGEEVWEQLGVVA